MRYTGRFAPSPTGPLHFGSLLAAVASYLQAKQNAGRWLLRIEDIDPPREQAGADVAIIAALEQYGFEWDGPVTYQSHSNAYHEELIHELVDSGRAYPCNCSRRDLAGARRGPLGMVYPGTCRNGCNASETSIRVKADGPAIEFVDGLQGPQSMLLSEESGDFIIRRRDGLIAYQLAVVADDALQGISEVVRGIDLLPATPRQILLQQLLGLATPQYAHIPVVEVSQGQKLSKQTGAPAIPAGQPGPILFAALTALGQRPAEDLRTAPVDDIWKWAVPNWAPKNLVGIQHIPSDQDPLAGPKNGLS